MSEDGGSVERRDEYGICVSGGGIRAASFGLGALQAIQAKTGLVAGKAPAGYISAVSGGSYIVGAIAMLKSSYPNPPEARPRRGRARRPSRASEDVSTWTTPPWIQDPFAPGTPELEHLRRRARYLVGGVGSVNLVVEFTVRLLLNLGFIALVIFVPARMFGWVLGWLIDPFARADQLGDDLELGSLGIPLVLGAVLLSLSLLVAGQMVLVRRSAGSDYDRKVKYVSGLAVSGMALLAVAVALPAAVEFFVHVTSEGSSGKAADRSTPGLLARLGGLSALATILTSLLGLRSATTGTPEGSGKATAAKRGLLLAGRALLAFIATISVPLLFAALVITGVYFGATNSPAVPGERPGWEVAVVGGLAFCLLMIAVHGDPVKWSLYPFYKRRLMQCFCVERVRYERDRKWWQVESDRWGGPATDAAPDDLRPWRARERPYASRYQLSSSQPDDMPRVLICAAANISAFGESPAGQGALPFVFSAEAVGFPPGVVLPPGPHGAFRTKDLEAALARSAGKAASQAPTTIEALRTKWRGSLDANYLSMPSAVAVTGAAVSPMMGKMTIAPFRAIFALLNLRLGVWLPNPANEQVVSTQVPHRATDAEEGGVEGQDAELPTESGEQATTPVSRRRPLAIFKELFGRQGLDRKLVYVSDGGHYENLGLVELLRRGCTRIICVDASGDRAGTVTTLSEAMLLAEGELGVSWADGAGVDSFTHQLNLDKGAQDERSGLSTLRSTWTTIAYRLPGCLDEGVLLVLKTGVSQHTDAHLQQFQARNRTFPYDSTGNQLFRADRFDAYVALGRDSAEQALAATWLDGDLRSPDRPVAELT